MKNRLIALLLCLVLAVTFTGCIPRDNTITTTESEALSTQAEPTIPSATDGYDKVDPNVLDFSLDLYTAVELDRGFDALQTDAQRQCYRLMEDSVFYISQESEEGVYNILPVSVAGVNLTQSELHLIISAFTFDHPEVFWIDNAFTYYDTSGATHLMLASNMSAQQVTASAKEMHAELREVFSGMPGNLSEFDRELYIHDKLIERCEYADEATRADSGADIYTSLGSIVNSLAVCEGYTRGVQLMLSLVGIESYYVYGRGNNELHMWNSVRISDNWYYLDATWDDNGQKGASYNNFNITTEQALKDRTIAPLYSTLTAEEICGTSSTPAVNFNLFVPDCNADNMSFYAHNAVTVTGFDEENLNTIAQAIADAAVKDEEAVHLYIDPYYMEYQTAKYYLLSGDYLIFDCISRANSLLDGVTVSDESVATEESEDLYILTLFFEYGN